MSTPTTGSSTEATPTPPPEDRAEHGPGGQAALLRQIASMLDRSDVRDRLRHAANGEDLYRIVVDFQNNGH